MRNFLIKLMCLMGMHEWTTKADQGIPANEYEKKGGVNGYFTYARMYCKHCGKMSDLNRI